MKKREFIKKSGLLSASMLMAPSLVIGSKPSGDKPVLSGVPGSKGAAVPVPVTSSMTIDGLLDQLSAGIAPVAFKIGNEAARLRFEYSRASSEGYSHHGWRNSGVTPARILFFRKTE